MNIMKFFGFENDEDDYDDNDDYTEERRPARKTSKGRETSSRAPQGTPSASGRLILFNGIASANDKRRLREAFNSGAMILIDLHTLSQREFDEEGKDFITFMGGVAFARNGELKFIEPAQYLVTPRADMFEIWPEGSEAE